MPTTDIKTQLIKRVIDVLERNKFTAIRAEFNGSVYGAPTACLGHTPNITAHDSQDRFYIIEVPTLESDSLTDTEARCRAFAKHCDIHKGIFWIMPLKDKEVDMKSLVEKWELTSQVKLIRGINP